MRLLISALLVATSFAAKDSLRWNSEVREDSLERVNSFKPGFEYRFNLESQVSSGLPVPGSQQAALRTQSLVALSFPESESIAHLRIEKIRVASVQKEIGEPKKIQPFELFDEVELSEENLRTLRLPLRFRYEHGLVSEIEFDREDNEWSKNIKRVYLNMLQVNLSKKNVHEKDTYYLDNESEKNTVYSAPELTLEGDCEVTYTVVPVESRKESSEELRVTKSINFDKCSRRVGHQYNFRFGDKTVAPLAQSNFEREQIESSSLFNYRISGTPSRFLIREVELRSVYSFAPLSQENTLFTTVVSGNLRLIEVTKDEKRIPTPKSEKTESLLHSNEWEKAEERFLATGDESLLKKSPYPEMQKKTEMVVKMVRDLVEKTEEGVELEATHEMARLVRVLRLATKDDLKRMHKEICQSDSEKDSQLKEIFTDALALAGSFNTIEHLVEKIRSREISPLRSSHLLKQLVNIRVPSEKIIDSLVSLCKESKSFPLERQSCWLTVGSLMNGICGVHQDKQYTRDQCPRDLKEKFVRVLVDQYERASTRYERVLAIKTLANSGMDLIVFPLEKMIVDPRVEKTVRIQAIDALRKLRSVLPRKIVSILMPLYKNGREQPEIRVAAFHQIMQTLPEKTIIHQIVAQLEKEPSTQVYSFVYETLTQLSHSEIPHEKVMAESIRHSLKMVRPQESRKYLSSTYKHFNLFNEENKIGATLNWAALFSNDSVLPKEVMTTLESTFAGQWNKYLAQIGFSQNNIDQVLFNLYKKFSSEEIEQVLVRGKRSSSAKPTEILSELFSKMSVVSRKQKEQDPHAYIYIRFRDMDYAVIPMEEELLPQIVKSISRNGRIELGEIESILAKGFRFNNIISSIVYERTHSIINSMGMPLVYSAKLPTIVKVEGQIKVEFEPKNGKSFDGLRLRVQARPSIAANHLTKVEIISPLVNLGVKLVHSAQARLPIDMTTEINWSESLSIKNTFVTPKESLRLAQISTRPSTFVRVWPKLTRTYVQPIEKTIYVDQLETRVHKLEHSILERATGLKINVDGHIHGHIFESGMENLPSPLLIGENNVEINFERTEETPKEFVLNTEVEMFKKETRMEKPEGRFFNEDNEEYFETEQYDEMEEPERKRRGEYEEYVKSVSSEKAYKHRVMAEIKSIGGRKEHKAVVEVKTVCEDRFRHCKVVLEGLRTPIVEEEKRDWVIEAKAEMLYPEMPETLGELLRQKHRELTLSVNARFGGEKKNEVEIKIQGEQNKEQKKWMKVVASGRTEELTALEEYERLVEASMLNQYKAYVKYDIQCPITHSLVDRFYTLIKANAPFFKTSVEYGNNQKNVVRAQLTIEPETRQYANISIHTPTEKVVLREIRLPYSAPLLNIRRESMTPLRSLSHIGSALSENTRPMCKVESNKVRSFDDVIYRTPLTTCYSVLAKDCSSEQPEFAVLIKKISKNGEEKKIKIVSTENVIECEWDKKEDKMIVRVDGEKVDNVERLEKIRVYKKNDLVRVELDDVTVEFDGYTAEIKMSEYYKNKQCGICGHFDGEKKNEFRRADNEETEDIEEFHRSYLVKDSECEVEERRLSEKRNYRVESESSSSEEESIFETEKWEKKESKKNVQEKKWEKENEVEEPELKTRVIEFSHRVCFSKKPVNECPSKTMEDEEEMKETKVEFACFSRSSSEASRLLREARRSPLYLEKEETSYTETLALPKLCTVY